MCALRIKAMFFNMWTINAHAPTEDKDKNIKEEYYSKLERLYDSLPSNDIKRYLGDLNTKIGKEDTHKGIVGNHSLHQKCNDNGQRLINFAASKNLVISSTAFLPTQENPHKYQMDIHRIK